MANLRVDKITSTETFETTGSVQFDGTGDVLTVPNSADFRLGNGDFTIECWFYYKGALSSNRTLFGLFENSSARRSYQVEVRSNGVIRFEWWPDGSTGNSIDTAASTVSISTWHHYAVTRTNGIITQYLNGESVVSRSVGTSSFYDNTVDAFRIGALNAAVDQSFSGHISNVRVVKGKALYTENFTPPTRELTVTPETVLLACQHKTDASHEKTGKTITVNGNAVANELTPGLLTDVVKSGGNSAITGSVEFDGTGDYLSLADTTDFDIGLNNEPFTWEVWFNMTSPTTVTNNLGLNRGGGTAGWNSTDGHQYQAFHYTDNKLYWQFWNGSSNVSVTSNANEVSVGSWNHFAVTYDGTTTRGFLNGIQFPTTSTSNYAKPSSSNISRIGTEASGSNFGSKFQSNIRIIKGTALYTANFIPPTRELKKVPGTVLLCCQDENSVTTEATGKTITSNGNPAASNFTPQVGNDGSVEFVGPTKINTENYFYLPTGDTESRFPNFAGANGGGRGLFAGNNNQPADGSGNTIEYITISSTGNTQDFGDRIGLGRRQIGAVASPTRAVFAGSYGGPVTNTIDYVTIASTGDAKDFGDCTTALTEATGISNSTRGIFAGGRTPTVHNVIQYITIQSTGNAIDFGDLSDGRRNCGSCQSTTRGIIASGRDGLNNDLNIIEYITISSTGNVVDFGDLVTASHGRETMGGGNATRGIFSGGGPAGSDVISFVTIASTGDAKDFGDNTASTGGMNTMACSSTRAVMFGAAHPARTLSYVTTMSTGNAIDFGDFTVDPTTNYSSGCSNGHGGLG